MTLKMQKSLLCLTISFFVLEAEASRLRLAHSSANKGQSLKTSVEEAAVVPSRPTPEDIKVLEDAVEKAKKARDDAARAHSADRGWYMSGAVGYNSAVANAEGDLADARAGNPGPYVAVLEDALRKLKANWPSGMEAVNRFDALEKALVETKRSKGM